MELEGFGASLIGRVLYVYASHADAWVPWEFISGTPYTAKILICGSNHNNLHLVEAEHAWTVVFRPSSPKDWSCIATLLRALGPTILLVFDVSAPPAPPSFVSFLDVLLQEGRTTLTRIWIGEHIEIPAIPDAVFFPILHDSKKIQDVYALLGRLPGRANHGPWAAIPQADWTAIVKATQESNLGIVVSDVGEPSWSLFWHKLADSRGDSHAVLTKRGLAWARTGLAMVEKNHDSQ